MDRLTFTLNQIEKFKEPDSYCYTQWPDYVTIGKNCRIKQGVYFSPQGFGFQKFEGAWIHIPHSGKIIIEDYVEIFEGANIVRATAEDGVTLIGSGTKIDYNVHVAHNVRIGRNCLIIAGSIIGGSAVIGDDCYLGIGCMIKNKVKIGNGCTIGMGAVVIRDVPDGATVVGNPAKQIGTKL